MAYLTAQDAAQSDFVVRISDAGDESALLDTLAEVISVGAKSLMILACSANSYSPSRLENFLRQCPVPVCGGVFPEVFHSSVRLSQGFVVVGLPFSISISCYTQISASHLCGGPAPTIDGDIPGWSQDLLVFVDAASVAAEDFINGLYEEIGGGIDVIGGGCGALDFKPRPCIFCRLGLVEDAALVVSLPVAMQCANDHGWQILSGPYLVTESEAVRVKTINYLPAFEVYKNLLEEITDHRFLNDNFFSISQNFPLGIVGLNRDILVRDPIQVVDGELVCVGRVPVNSMIYILCAQPDNIIQAAEDTGRKLAMTSTAHFSSGGLAVAFDCVSRALYLAENFDRELKAVQCGLGESKVLVGVLSIGEIANTAQGTINFLNKSIVVGKI